MASRPEGEPAAASKIIKILEPIGRRSRFHHILFGASGDDDCPMYWGQTIANWQTVWSGEVERSLNAATDLRFPAASDAKTCDTQRVAIYISKLTKNISLWTVDCSRSLASELTVAGVVISECAIWAVSIPLAAMCEDVSDKWRAQWIATTTFPGDRTYRACSFPACAASEFSFSLRSS